MSPPPNIARTFEAPTFSTAGKAALFSRGLIILSGVVSSILLPLVLDQTSVGQFFLAQILIAGLSTFGQLGLTYSIPATVTEAASIGDFGRARRLAVGTVALAASAGLVAAAVAWLTLSAFGSWLEMEGLPGWIAAVPIIAAIVPLTTLTAVLVELLRAVHAIRASANLAAIAGTLTAAYLTFVLATGAAANLREVLQVGLVGSGICVLFGAFLATWTMSGWKAPARKAVSLSEILLYTLPNLLTTLLLFALAQIDILLLSMFGAMSDVAKYGIALRFSALLLLPLGIANMAFAPLAVQARSTSNEAAIHQMLSKLVMVSAALALLLYVGFVLAGYALITLWNATYLDSYALALILGLGQVVHACGGSAGILLMIWGDQRRAVVITVVTSLVTVALCFLGLRYGGMYGLALGAALGNVLQVLSFVHRVKRRFNFDPSLLGVLIDRRRADGAA